MRVSATHQTHRLGVLSLGFSVLRAWNPRLKPQRVKLATIGLWWGPPPFLPSPKKLHNPATGLRSRTKHHLDRASTLAVCVPSPLGSQPKAEGSSRETNRAMPCSLYANELLLCYDYGMPVGTLAADKTIYSISPSRLQQDCDGTPFLSIGTLGEGLEV